MQKAANITVSSHYVAIDSNFKQLVLSDTTS